MSDRIKQIISHIFNMPLEQINDDTSPDNFSAWDSLAHINLILAIESEFGISLLPEEAMEMLSVRLIRIILEERGVI